MEYVDAFNQNANVIIIWLTITKCHPICKANDKNKNTSEQRKNAEFGFDFDWFWNWKSVFYNVHNILSFSWHICFLEWPINSAIDSSKISIQLCFLDIEHGKSS